MAKITNETAKEAVNQSVNQTANNTGQAAEATSVLDQTLGPISQFWDSLPIYGKVGVIGMAGAGFLIYHWIQNREKDTKLEATDWKQKMDNLFKIPTEKAGRPDDTLLFNQSDSAGKRTIGVIKKLNTSHVDISSNELKEAVNDDDKWKEMESKGVLQGDGVTYSVVTGRKKLGRMVNNVIYKLAGVFSSGSNPQAEYFDLTKDEIKTTDNGIVIKEDVHIFKENGLWQTEDTANQARKIELTSTVQLQNYLESLQKHPEFYSDLNMNISGVKNIENTKSKNMREYKKDEKLREKGEGMQE